MNIKALSVILALGVLSPMLANAVEPSEVLSDPALEARAREVGKGLRCVVCQNQSIDDSNADLAGDMRRLVRDRILKGDTNEQVMAYMVDRYGDFVLLDPPFKASTYVLWLGPGLIAGLGVLSVVVFYRRRSQDVDGEVSALENKNSPKTSPLNNEERQRLEKLMKEDDA